MDRRPTLETRPPVLIDAVVRTLIPPACREHVVGDLWERYRSPWQFVLDAARDDPVRDCQPDPQDVHAGRRGHSCIPPVCGFRCRRGTTVAGCCCCLWRVARVRSARRLQARFLDLGQTGRHRPGVRRSRSPRVTGDRRARASRPVVAAPRVRRVPGGFGVIFLLRLQNPLGAVPRQALTLAPATREALMTEIRLSERMSRRGYRIEAVHGRGSCRVLHHADGELTNWVLRIGWALGPRTHCMWQLSSRGFRRHRWPRVWSSSAALAHYRGELERRRHQVQTLVALVPPAHGARHAPHHAGRHDRGSKEGETTLAGGRDDCADGWDGNRYSPEQSGLGTQAAHSGSMRSDRLRNDGRATRAAVRPRCRHPWRIDARAISGHRVASHPTPRSRRSLPSASTPTDRASVSSSA